MDDEELLLWAQQTVRALDGCRVRPCCAHGPPVRRWNISDEFRRQALFALAVLATRTPAGRRRLCKLAGIKLAGG